MEKRQPLSVMIALQGKKPGASGNSPDSGGDEPDGDEGGDDPRYDDEGMVSAAADMIDAFKARDSQALNVALCHWLDAHGPVDESSSDDGKSN